MAKWGRSLDPAGPLAGRPAYSRGAKSVFCAFLALALVIGALAWMVSLPADASQAVTNLATIVLVAVYVVVAPILHIAGTVFAVTGLFRVDDRRWLCILGAILNIGLLGAGVLLGSSALLGIGAFT